MNLLRCFCRGCQETTLHRGLLCIHCGASFLRPEDIRPLPYVTPVVRSSGVAKPKTDPALLIRICGWCKEPFEVPHLSYPAHCCSVQCAQRRRRSLHRNAIRVVSPRNADAAPAKREALHGWPHEHRRIA